MDLPHHATRFKLGLLPLGAWDWTVYGGWRGEAARVVVAVRCPACARMYNLANHAIDAAGNVSPSAPCPRSGCSWHPTLRLLGWHPPPPLPTRVPP